MRTVSVTAFIKKHDAVCTCHSVWQPLLTSASTLRATQSSSEAKGGTIGGGAHDTTHRSPSDRRLVNAHSCGAVGGSVSREKTKVGRGRGGLQVGRLAGRQAGRQASRHADKIRREDEVSSQAGRHGRQAGGRALREAGGQTHRAPCLTTCACNSPTRRSVSSSW